VDVTGVLAEQNSTKNLTPKRGTESWNICAKGSNGVLMVLGM